MRTMEKINVLIADDDDSLRRVLEFQLKEAGYEVTSAEDGQTALEIFSEKPFDCVIADLRMPRLSGLQLIEKIREADEDVPIVVITAYGEVETAITAMKMGAFDYIRKPFNKDEILLTIERALSFFHTRLENRRLHELVHESYGEIIAESSQMRAVMEIVKRVARSDVTVLIEGESGTGKELIAKTIHLLSRRKDKPFIAINCAAIPETLIESELFGYKRGSFTGATQDSKGKFEAADGGTIFLDEISQMPLSLQPKLLRVLQEQEVVRIGEILPRKVDVRIIAATNQSLKKMVQEGTFREDLYFRLAVIPINLPPLRSRKEDIPLLINHFFKRAKQRHGFKNLKMSKEVIEALIKYDFPGNVRELENLIERMVVLSDGETLKITDVPEHILKPKSDLYNVRIDLPSNGIQLEEIEREIIRRALQMNDWNQSKTARYLGITRSALIYRMRKFGLDKAD